MPNTIDIITPGKSNRINTIRFIKLVQPMIQVSKIHVQTEFLRSGIPP